MKKKKADIISLINYKQFNLNKKILILSLDLNKKPLINKSEQELQNIH